MPREFPVGTIRSWSQGDVIKAHLPIPPFSNGWISLKTTSQLDAIGGECDSISREILSHKVPINGEKFLDHEIEEFAKRKGLEEKLTPDSLKQYEGFYGAGRYAFRNEFSRLYMENDMNLHRAICEAFDNANRSKGGDRDHDVLTEEEKKEIRARVRSTFKEEALIINVDLARELLKVVQRTQQMVQEGLEFKDPEKRKAYEEFKKIADALPESYELLSKKRMQKLAAEEILNNAFADNWGVRESCLDYLDKKFSEFVRKFANRIAEDTLQEQLEMFGVTVDMEPDEFYSKLYDKAKNQDWDFLKRYIGKEITLLYLGRRIKVKLLSDNPEEGNVRDIYFYYETLPKRPRRFYLIPELINPEIDLKLAPEYDERVSDFKQLIYLRFMKRYDKVVDGEWAFETLPAIHNLEKLMNELPDGHCKTNEQLKYITNRDYKGGPHGGYAWYAPSERRINLSALCVERGAVWGQLDKSTEFRSVMFHEIGHAVSQKLRREASYDYRKFAVECGWSYAQPEFREGLQKEKHMGSNKIPRRGSNSSNTLLTSYSATSPEEAFAEYYSFYNLNKPAIDRFFETKDRRHLRQEKQTVIRTASSDIKVGDVVRFSFLKPESYDKYRQVSDHLSERAEHQIKLYSPWELSLSREEKMRLDPGQVKQVKNVDPALLNPAVVVRGQGSKRTAIYGGITIEVARMNRKMVPVIKISNEQYQRLREQQFKDEEIASFVFEENRSKSIPRQTAPPKQIAGLVYRDEIIPEEVILENVGALKVMKKICESEQLKKALEEMFVEEESLKL